MTTTPDIEARIAGQIAADMRIPADDPMTAEQAAEFRERFAEAIENHDLRILPPSPLEDRVAALEAEVARLSQPEPDADFMARLDRVFPEVSRRQMKRAAMNWPGQSRPSYPS